MLSELHVRDLGVISDLTLQLEPGMTVLTGETGAGKTLLVQALQLVLGGRATPGLVRAGSEEALVEARFAVGDGDRGAEGDVDGGVDGVDVVLARGLPASGRSRAWADGRMVPVQALAERGAALVDIHGQHEQQSLVAVAAQRAALDGYARADLRPLDEARRALADITRRLAELGGDERDRARQVDLLRYQVAEIEAAGITDVDEEAALATEEARLTDLAALRQAAGHAAAALDDPDGVGGATSLLGEAMAALSGREALGEWEDRLRQAHAEVTDVAADLRGVVETWEDDPSRLDEIFARRRLLADLRRKYGDTLAEVAAFGDEARRTLGELERREEVAADLERRRAEAEKAVAAAARQLRQMRAAAAPGLAATATERLQTLAMPDARLEVAIEGPDPGDGVQFLLGANRGEPVQPLARVASGGELARTMLALRLVVEGGAPTMLFDEVDAGVGGAAALALGRALHEVARTRQVLVVTHLAQVAAFADHQVAVRKEVDAGGRTVTTAEPLDAEGRVVELSRMLSGHPDSPTARAHAEELLLTARGSNIAAPPDD